MTRVTPTVLLVFALLSTAIATAGETIQNGGFEAQTTVPWQPSRWNGDANVELDRKQVHSGACSIRLQARKDTSTAVVTQTVKRLPENGGNVAFLAGWWRGQALSGTGGRIAVRMLGRDGRSLRDVAPITANGTFDWKPFAHVIQLPKDTAKIQVFLELWSSAGTVWFDDVSLGQQLPIDWHSIDDKCRRTVHASPYLLNLADGDEPCRFTLVETKREGTCADTALSVLLVDGEDKVVARHAFALGAITSGKASSTWAFDGPSLPDGVYRMVTDDKRRIELARLQVALRWVRLAESLPRCRFEWKSLNCHGPGGLRTAAECVEMVRQTKAMGFDCLLFDGKTPNGQLYYRSKVGRPAAITEKFDPLEVTAKACKRAGLQILVQFCSFAEGKNTIWLEEHPEWVEVDPGESADWRKQRQIFGCPDRPEVRRYELALIREILTNYPVDGISFDYIRYKNDRACYCDYSERTLKEMVRKQGLSEETVRAQRARETIIGFTQSVRKLADEIRPGLLLHGYTHPAWANEFPLNYHSQRASAHGKDPSRGGQWPLEMVFQQAKRNVDTARAVHPFPVAAPMSDTGYTHWAKSARRFRNELRTIQHAGAKAVMVYPYSTLRAKPELRRMLAEEFGGNPEKVGRDDG